MSETPPPRAGFWGGGYIPWLRPLCPMIRMDVHNPLNIFQFCYFCPGKLKEEYKHEKVLFNADVNLQAKWALLPFSTVFATSFCGLVFNQWRISSTCRFKFNMAVSNHCSFQVPLQK
jgi:hypothetical protein